MLADVIAVLALVQYVYERGDGTAVGVLLTAYSAPRLLGPLSGAVVDRVSLRPLLAATAAGQAVVVGMVPLFMPPIPVVVVLVVLTGTLAITFVPAGRSAVPSLVGRDNLPAANAILAVGTNLALALGPAVGGLVAAWAGVRVALTVVVALFGLAALMALVLPRSLGREPGAQPPGRWLSEVRDGLAYAGRQPAARAVLIGLVAGVLFAAVSDPAFPFLAQDELGSDASGFGLLVAAWGIGMTGATLALVRMPRLEPRNGILLGIGLMGAGILAAGVAPLLLIAAGLLVVGGAGNGVHNVSNDTLIGQTVPNRLLGRVFGTAATAAAASATVAYLAGGVLVDLAGPRLVFIASGAGCLLALVIVARLLPDIGRLDALRGEVDEHRA
jgi:MFS family permease